MKAHTEKYCHLQLERLDDRITPSNVAPQANFGNLVSALNNVAAQIDHVNALNNLTTTAQVQVVNVQDVLNGNNVQALNNALNHNATNVQILQDFLNHSVNNNNVQILDQAFQDFLNNNTTTVFVPVAVNVLSGGQVVLFALPTP